MSAHAIRIRSILELRVCGFCLRLALSYAHQVSAFGTIIVEKGVWYLLLNDSSS